MEAFCKTCDSVQEVERSDDHENNVYCLACGDEFPYSSVSGSSGGGKFENYKIGRIVRVEPVAKSKDLKLCHVDVSGDGNDDNLLPIVTNAKYAEAGWKVIVACIGAVVPAGATVSAEGDDEDAMRVVKKNISGVESRGMLCDCQMLGWTGGAKGFIQQLPDSFNFGDAIPDSRPRV
jgi:tRNA-binding EMAP/Myf-like protein